MSIYWKNNPDKRHLDLIWNDWALSFFEEICPNNNNNMSSDMGLVPDPKRGKLVPTPMLGPSQ